MAQLSSDVCVMVNLNHRCMETKVRYSDEELQAYVNTREPYDKAGGYAIQGTFGKYVDHIEGDRDNSVGLPWYRVEKFLD